LALVVFAWLLHVRPIGRRASRAFDLVHAEGSVSGRAAIHCSTDVRTGDGSDVDRGVDLSYNGGGSVLSTVEGPRQRSGLPAKFMFTRKGKGTMPGLQYYKIDLHTHTPASKCYRHKQHTAEEIVKAALDKGLHAIAITDHNTAEWIDQMKEAAKGTDLVIFPGVEVSMDRGFHIVAIFDPDVDQQHVENFLGGIDITSDFYGKQNALCKKSPEDVVKKIHDRKGLAILAHIDLPRGAFYQQVEIDQQIGQVLRVPQECAIFFNELRYDAVECAGGQFPEKFDKAHGFKRFPPFYQASDSPDPEDHTKHSKDGLGTLHSWFHMDQINLEGLRQCFVDPEVRICLMDEYEERTYPQIVSMRVGQGGFFYSPNFDFHKGLNCIIGGKGVGKSLAVEFLRFAMGQPSEDPDIARDHLGKLHKQLTEGNEVEVIYQLSNGTKYRITCIYEGRERGEEGDFPRSSVECVNLDTSEPFTGDIARMFPMLAYSQTEVIKITEDKEAQLNLIDRLIETQPHERQIAQLGEKLRDNDKRLAEALDAKGRLEECEQEISTLREQIENINKTLADPLFEAMKKAEAKKGIFERQQDFVQSLIEQVEEWKEEIASLTVEALPDDWQEDESLKAQQSISRDSKARVKEVLDELIKELVAQKEAAVSALTKWLPEFSQVEDRYNQLLEKSGGDQKAQERQRKELEKQKKECEKNASRYKGLAENLEEVMEERATLLDQLAEAHRSYFETRKAKFDYLTEASDGKLQLTLEHAADREEYTHQLVELLKGGQNAPSVAMRRQIADKVSPKRFVELIVERDAEILTEESGLTELWAGRVLEKLWSHDDFAEVLALQHACYPTDVPFIRFRKPSGNYEELSDLSVGQKCTALLIIALCDGTMPVLIDQPEDALDIVSVWEDIAQKLRKGKDARQFILTTHNSSIAVSADSDQFIVLEEAGGDHGKVLAAGAIDRPEVRRAVIKRLEGGDKPYKLRSRKYNIPIS